ncbi:MAG: Uma2 family endonuclease [Gemmatimonadota bacterium]
MYPRDMAYRAHGPKLITIEEFEQLDEPGYRVELSHGLLVREPLAGHTHGRIASRIDYRLRRFVEEKGLGEVYGAETGFVLSREARTVRGPDVAFVSRERMPLDLSDRGYFPAAPDLAVEVVSPSNTAAQLQAKVLDYLRAGVRIVWVVYPETLTVAEHTSLAQFRFLGSGEELDGGALLPGLRLPVDDVFGVKR